VFKFNTPTINALANSPYTKFLTPIIRPFVTLNHSIRRLFDALERYQVFVYGDVAMFRNVLPKFAVGTAQTGSSTMPIAVVSPHPATIGLTREEEVYVNHVFMMNEALHQNLIGGADSKDNVCLYKAFRGARIALTEFREKLTREPLPRWFWLMHGVAGTLAWLGLWQILRWFEVL
jgi:hypothetical protein